ncbi:MAG: ornithine carbamoyltransferase [Oscillospiraceae bacterium]|nr:ornithine carbamoyltransferase [Oscillospiraceae bacterium]
MTKHLLRMQDLSKDNIIEILNFADKLKHEKKNNIQHNLLQGKTLAMIFKKSSTRTRVSFETGMYQLGGHALCLNAGDLQIGRGEPVEDTARVLSRYVDGIMIRTFAHQEVDDLAKYGSIPVINGLTDEEHPCQVLADLMTIREYKGKLDGIKLCYIGDGNNMANSLITGGLTAGLKVSVACPDGYKPHKFALDFAEQYGDNFLLTNDIFKAACGADVIYTDVWASMGMEADAQQRMIDFQGYCVDNKLLSIAKDDVIVQHCLPAHRGEEITAEAFEAHAAEIFEEAENRLHVQKAVLAMLL